MNRILIVDDNHYIRYVISVLLEESGYKTATAEDRKKALEEIKLKEPELIVLDKKLPDCDGIDFLEEIKKEHPDIPVIMLTANASEENAERAINAEAFAFVTKPFENKEIISVINKALQNKV